MPVSLNNNVAQVSNTQPVKQSGKKTDEKSMSLTPTQTKVAVGTGLAALAAIGIYVATRGKSGRVPNNTQETANTIKEMTVDAFKKAGNKFNKGKAVTSTGEGFTGQISHQTKGGKNVVMEYENGILQKSTKYDGENIVTQKIYKYDEDSNLFVIQDGKAVFGKVTDTTNGLQRTNFSKGFMIKNVNTGKLKTLQIEGQGLKDFYYDENGALKGVRHHFQKDGVCHHDTILYSSDGSKRMKIQGDGLTTFYDKNGVPIDEISVDITRGNSSLWYHGLSYSSDSILGGVARQYSYMTPQGIEGTISRTNRANIKDKNTVVSRLYLENSGGGYIISKNGKDIQIKRNGEKEIITNDSDEYKNVLAQSSDFMKQFLTKYKTALGLQRQVNEGLKSLEG